MYIYIYIYIYIYCGKKTMQNNFTWSLKFHAGGPSIFQLGTTIIKKFTVFEV